MTGLIWTKQVLNYPLLALIDPGGVPRYEQAHNRRFIWLVGPAGVYDRFVGNQVIANRVVRSRAEAVSQLAGGRDRLGL
jgi:hypothetical protein